MSLERLREAFEDEDPEIRRTALLDLAESPEEGAEDLLLAALGDGDWRVRKEAAEVAVLLSHRLELVPGLLHGLCQGENVGLRNAALDVLGRLGGQATDALIDAFRATDAGERKFLIDALGDQTEPRIVPLLVGAADDEDPNVAAAALDALARVGGDEAERALRRRLTAPDPFQRMAALDGLARLDAVVPWSELAPLLGDRLARRVALPVLGRSGSVEAVAPLVDALTERSRHVVREAAVGLVRLVEPTDEIADEARERLAGLALDGRVALRELLLDGDALGRTAAAQLLLMARDESALEGVMALAADGALSPEGLAEIRHWGRAAARPLLEVYRHAEGPARGIALEVASDLAADAMAQGASDAELIGRVQAAVREGERSTDPGVRLAATRSLTWWASDEDAVRLVEATREGDPDLARAAAAALEAMADREPRAVAAALKDAPLDGPGGAALAGVIARVGVDGAFEQLQTGLSSQDADVRRAAVDGLVILGGERAAEMVAYALADEQVDVRAAAARALGHLRDEAGRPFEMESLLLALRSDSPAVQAAAARALGEAGDGRAVEPLRELVRAASAGVAVAAMEALRALRDPTLHDLLVEALGHPDEEVVKQALRAIRDAEGPRTATRLAVGLAHPAWHVRVVAARLLGEIADSAARSALTARLTSEDDPSVRAALEEALATRDGGDDG